MASVSAVPTKKISGGSFLLEDRQPNEVFTPEDFNEQHHLIAQTAEDFANNEILPNADKLEHKDWALARELLKKASDLGLTSVDIPEAYGGAAMSDPGLREDFAHDVVLLKYVGMNPIVVHGGGPGITEYMQRLGMQVEFVEGLRVSDEATVEVAKMVLVGKVNKDIVLRLNHAGQPAVGLSGDDGLLFRVGKQLAGGERDIGFVGRIERVDVDVLNHIAEDYIPVVASVGADREGSSYNVNADTAAGAVAEALGAHKVVFLTDVDGWLDEAGGLISFVHPPQVRERLGEVSGGMRPKLEACLDAVESGVTSAHIVDGRKPHSVLLELFTDTGIGTKIAQ